MQVHPTNTGVIDVPIKAVGNLEMCVRAISQRKSRSQSQPGLWRPSRRCLVNPPDLSPYWASSCLWETRLTCILKQPPNNVDATISLGCSVPMLKWMYSEVVCSSILNVCFCKFGWWNLVSPDQIHGAFDGHCPLNHVWVHCWSLFLGYLFVGWTCTHTRFSKPF